MDLYRGRAQVKFDLLKLLVAVSKVNRRVPDKTEARNEYLLEARDEFMKLTGDVCFPFTATAVFDVGIDYRKNDGNKLKANIADMHGTTCFWHGRDKGPCCEYAEAGHIAPAHKGNALTVANGMIECHCHNRQRGTRSIEEYLLSDDRTDNECGIGVNV